ncbi:MAG: FHA domain-containing protein [Planctomycetota bacterium]
MPDLPGSPNRNPRLLMRGPGKPRVVELPALPAVVGRGSQCDVVAPGKTVAREHLKIAGSVAHMTVENVAADGTLYNGAPLRQAVRVHDRDTFVCGDVQVQFFLPLPSSRAKLVMEMLDPPVAGKIVELPQTPDKTVTVGRTAKNDLTIVHKKTSGEHGVIMRRPTGALVVVDNGSTNGTRINGEELPANTPREIGVGDLVQFGQVIGLLRPADYLAPGPSASARAASVAVPASAGDALASSDGSDDDFFQPPQPVSSEPAPSPVRADVTLDPLAGLGRSGAVAAEPDLGRVPMPWEIGQSVAGGGSDVPDEVDESLIDEQQQPVSVAESSIADASLVATPSAALDLPPMSDDGVSVAASPESSVPVPDADLLPAARFAHAVGNSVPPVKGPALVALPESGRTEPPPEQPISAKLDGAMLVGRKRGMDLRLPHSEISGLHAMLDPDVPARGGPKGYVVRNAGALNGVYVNGVRTESQSLRHLDQVSFGPFRYIYVADGKRYPCPLREFPPEIQKRVRLETEGELRVRRPFMLVLFELCALMVGLGLLAIMLLAFTGVLPSLNDTLQMLAGGYRS